MAEAPVARADVHDRAVAPLAEAERLFEEAELVDRIEQVTRNEAAPAPVGAGRGAALGAVRAVLVADAVEESVPVARGDERRGDGERAVVAGAVDAARLPHVRAVRAAPVQRHLCGRRPLRRQLRRRRHIGDFRADGGRRRHVTFTQNTCAFGKNRKMETSRASASACAA